MVSSSGDVKKSAASRASRHTKKYWRKGANIDAIEETLHKMSADASRGGAVEDREDQDLFQIDRTPTDPKKKYTRKQQAALDKISRSVSDAELVSLPPPKAPATKKLAKLKKRVSQPEPIKNKIAKSTPSYDLWEKDFVPKVDLPYEAAAEHFLRYTKKKIPTLPGTMRHVPSLLKAVAAPAAGASYNPDADEYKEYVESVAKKEESVIRYEERIKNGIKPKYEKVVTQEERYLELTEGLVIDPRYNDEDMEETEEKEETVPAKPKTVKTTVSPVVEEGEGEKSAEVDDQDVEEADLGIKRKTKKQRLAAAREKKEERERKQRKTAEKHQHDVFKAKKIHKQLDKEEEDVAKKAIERKQKKITKQMTKRQRLGRGDFVEEEEPFLLQDELTGSLRQLKPQGSILTDRIKSMQKRNILPIGGDAKNDRRLKTKLKRKIVDRRTVNEVKKGSDRKATK